jgi:hypothetical protein
MPDQQAGVVVPQLVELVPCGAPPALTAARHTDPNVVRRIGRPPSAANTKPFSAAGYFARCAASKSTTTVGSGMLRTDAGVFGAAK